MVLKREEICASVDGSFGWNSRACISVGVEHCIHDINPMVHIS